MQREQEDAEVVVSLDYLRNEATICVSDWPAQARKFEKLFGDPTKLTRQTSRYTEDGKVHAINRVRSAIWKVPLGAITLTRRRGGPKKSAATQEVPSNDVLKQKQAS